MKINTKKRSIDIKKEYDRSVLENKSVFNEFCGI